ncbi:MAG: MFS transporter, partial [Lentisphaeraceae bacterium]|nr:MFS transporter [Lentisphaeraceae bacterium]
MECVVLGGRMTGSISGEEKKRAHRNIFLCQCTGLMAPQFFQQGFMLNYIKKFGLDDSLCVLLLTFIPSLCTLLLILPLGYLSDRCGMKKIGMRGNILQAMGCSLFTLAYWLPDLAVPLFIVAILVFSLGVALFTSNWFALLDPLINAGERGAFFAKLRISWQLIAIILTFI